MMDKRVNELIELLKRDSGFFGNQIYKNLMCIDGVQSNFNEQDLRRLYVACAIIGSKKGISLEEFDKNLNSLLLSPKLDQYVENFRRTCKKEEWYQIEQEPQESYPYKLYMSVDNSDLCFVATKFIQESLKRNRHDFSFKVNLKESVNRRDNIVVYCTKENLQFYYRILNLAAHKAKVNAPHLLGCNLGNNIYGGTDFENGTVSFSEKVCDDFYRQLNDSVFPENIAVDYYMNLSNADMVNLIEYGVINSSRKK